MRVLIVEDHQVVAEGLELALSRVPDISVVATAGNIAEATAHCVQLRPQILLMDEHLPDGSGAAAARGLMKMQPDLRVVMLSADASDETLLAAVEAGASGYLLKTESAATVADALRRAAAGETLFSAATLQRLLRSRRRSDDAAKERPVLTPRELAVITLVAEGLDNDQIAERLGIELSTVRHHTQSVLSKLDVHTKLQAVLKAHDLGLLRS